LDQIDVLNHSAVCNANKNDQQKQGLEMGPYK